MVNSQESAPHGASGKTYVLVHGAWHGGWCWRYVAKMLHSQGHRVVTPTQTGLGNRRHLMARSITLDLFVEDLVNVIETEDLNDMVIVGHSFGSVPVIGVVDRMPERVRHMVFLDGMILQKGQSVFGMLTPEDAAQRRKMVVAQGGGVALPILPVKALGIAEGTEDYAWVERNLAPHPVGTYDSPLNINNPIGNGRPCTYIACTNPWMPTMASSQDWVRKQPNWKWLELATAHDAMITAPAELTAMLAAIG